MEAGEAWQRLGALNAQITAVDEEIAHLFVQRQALAEENRRLGVVMAESSVPRPLPAPDGEAAGYVEQTGELPAAAKVACQGVEGAFSHQAAERFFAEPTVTFCGQFAEVFQAVAAGAVDYGVLPIENSTAGSVGAVYDLLCQHACYILREVKVPVTHALLARKGTQLTEIAEVYSHPQALSQCAGYLAAHTRMQARTYSNTAAAAKYIAEAGNGRMAAIASRKCAQMYGLEILAENIQDVSHNTTRFICIGREPVFSAAAGKISMCLTLPHKPGALYHLLNKFAINQMNLTKLESRPWPERNFEFLFYLDVEGSFRDLQTRLLLKDLNNQLGYFKILGSYNEA